uniref:Putative replicase n=1 Tax=Ransystermes virus TaxID=2796628 RepID=A0A7T7GUU9_9VIRU|nr:putative replicase [Ransystermes virus]
MALKCNTGGDYLCKVCSPTLGKSTKRYLEKVSHFIKEKGVEWTVTRQKSIYQATLQLLSGDVERAKVILADCNIKSRKDRPGVPKGVEGCGVIACLHATTPQAKRKAIASLRGYTMFKLSKTSANQVKKAKDDITKPSNGKTYIFIPNTVRPFNRWLYPKGRGPTSTYPETVREVSKDFVLKAEHLSGLSSYYCGAYKVHREDRHLPYSSAALSSVVCGQVPKTVVALLGDLSLRRLAEGYQSSHNIPGYGRISFLQEGAGKARVVCTPSFWVQLYFKPLHETLFRHIRYLEDPGNKQGYGVSCVLNQNKGAYLLNTWLNEGRKLYSFDLQAATDRFPLEVQLAWLKKVGLGKWCDPVREVSRGQYYVPELSKPKVKPDYKVLGLAGGPRFGPVHPKFWTYGCGQPMGLYGSFPLFHLTHRSLLEDLSQKTSSPFPAYAVLGDDVLIGDPKLAEAYRDQISELGVPLSDPKTLESESIGSFAGFIGYTKYSADKAVRTVFRPFKYGTDFTFDGRVVEVLHSLGKGVRSWTTWWSKALDIFRRSSQFRHPDLSPIIPNDDASYRGGLSVGSSYFGAQIERVINRLSGPFGFSLYHDHLLELWHKELSALFEKQGPTMVSNFNPDLYKRVERQRRTHLSYARLGIELPQYLQRSAPAQVINRETTLSETSSIER